jgi:23S rRNA pseudouridine2605 synthase
MSSRSSSPKADTRGERVQKVLASAGFASRREIDRLIQAGRVVIDGRAAVPGDRLSGSENVLVDGKRVRLPSAEDHGPAEVLAYHKRIGEITARLDPEGRKTVFDDLPKVSTGRWIVIGRLDINTSGLLLFTTDGELAHRLMHPSYEIEREYSVRIRGDIDDEQLAALLNGVQLEDGLARFDQIRPGGTGSTNSWYHVSLHEGRNREVRRLFEAVNLSVSRLMRTRFGPVSLGRMQRGQWRKLEAREIASLYTTVGLEKKRA